MRWIVLVLAACPTVIAAVQAQTFTRETYSVPVLAGGQPIAHPFTGGLYNPMHQFLDIDADGDPDLFLFEPSDGSVTFFRNTGSASTMQLTYERDPFGVPPVSGWFRLADINHDAKADLLTSPGSGNSLKVYINTGTLQVPAFTLLTEAFADSAGGAVYSESFSISSFADMDADGDLDFLSLNTSIGTINYYENTGSSGLPVLAFRTDRYQDIQICVGCSDLMPDGNRHGNGALEFSDIDADGDPDMLYGDFFHNGVYFFRNVGTPQAAVLDSITPWFPPGDSVLTAGFNQPTLVDVDGDGDRDLFVGVMNSLVRFDNFWFYENVGSPGTFLFTESTRNFIPTLDFGLQATPALVDIDADGDPDLFAGNIDGRLALLRNTGTAHDPSFVFEDSAVVVSTTSYMYAPSFADIDGDGDFDLFIGHFAGKVEFYRNTGDATTPIFERELWFLDTLSVGSYAAPAFMDIDGDADLDCVVGRSGGGLNLYRNDGPVQHPRFTFVTSSFQGIAVNGNAKPLFVDIDGDGDRDVLVGASDGRLSLYRNDGPPSGPVFSFVTDTFGGIDTLHECAPAAGDIDGDGDIDLIVGCQRGGLELYRNATITGIAEDGSATIPLQSALEQNYPNPFNGVTIISFVVGREHTALSQVPLPVTLRIYDVLGREIATIVDEPLAPGRYSRRWDAGPIPSGVYWYRLNAGPSVDTRKLILLR